MPATAAPIHCPTCGHPRPTTTCPRCRGAAVTLQRRQPLRTGRGNPLADFTRGFATVAITPAHLLHARAFVGHLRLPLFANAVVFSLLVLAGVFGLGPLFTAAFTTPWPFADGLRTDLAERGPGLWLATTWLLLGPPLLEALAGGLHDHLFLQAEAAMLGNPAPPPAPRHLLARLRDRAQWFGIALLAWPLALGLVLLPWLGLPLVALLGAASAAVVWSELPMAQAGHGLRQRLRLCWRNRWRMLGLGLAIQLAAAIPFVNLLALAAVATVAAGTVFLQCDKDLV